MRNTFSHHQTTEPEVMQPTEHCIQMVRYIDILSSRVPSSITWNTIPPTLRQVNIIDQFQAGLGSITLPVQGADPGFQVRWSALKIFASRGRRRENFWGISCEKSRFYAKKIIFFPILGGGGGARRVRPPPWIRPWHGCIIFPMIKNN